MEEKEKSIEDSITKFTKMVESGLYMANPKTVGGEMVPDGVTIQRESKTIGTMTEANELFPDFPKKLAPKCEDLVIGSIILGLKLTNPFISTSQSVLIEFSPPTRKF